MAVRRYCPGPGEGIPCPSHAWWYAPHPDPCPRCGGALVPSESPYLLVCEDCERRWPPEVVRVYCHVCEPERKAQEKPRKQKWARW